MFKYSQITISIFFLVSIAFTTGCSWDYLEVSALPEEVSFKDHIMPIFDQSCNMNGCHGTNGIPPELTSTHAYNALLDGGDVVAFEPENSRLLTRMKATGNPMPPDAMLPQIKLEIVEKWIADGALDN